MYSVHVAYFGGLLNNHCYMHTQSCTGVCTCTHVIIYKVHVVNHFYVIFFFGPGGGDGFADFESAFTSKPEEQQAVGGGEKHSFS